MIRVCCVPKCIRAAVEDIAGGKCDTHAGWLDCPVCLNWPILKRTYCEDCHGLSWLPASVARKLAGKRVPSYEKPGAYIPEEVSDGDTFREE